MDFLNKHAMANTVNQLQPQKITNSVWLGPLNSVAQYDFLAQNNIKYVIGILACQKCCYYLKDFTQEQFCCVAIDPYFNVQKLTEDEGESLMKFNTKFSPNISTVTNNKISNAVLTNINFQKIIEDFLDMIHCIQQRDPQAGILMFSLNGNDNLISTFAMSLIQDMHNCDIQQSFKYLKSIRPSIKDFDEMGFYANELVKFQLANKARKQFGTKSNSPHVVKAKRSAMDIHDHDESELESPRRAKRTFI